MNNNARETNEQLLAWVTERIETEYPGEVALVLGNSPLLLPQDAEGPVMSYFVPATERAAGLARTFILDGVGHDLFAIPWERLDRFAALEEYNLCCLLDNTILYARSDEDRARFAALQRQALAHLQDDRFVMQKALERLATAMELFQTMAFEQRLGQVRKAGGFIADFLSVAVAFVNHRYFRESQAGQLAELQTMSSLPRDFVPLYRAVIGARGAQDVKQAAYQLIANTRDFLSSLQKPSVPTPQGDFQQLACWYEELSYTWRRVRHYCGEGTAERAFIWGVSLQYELDIVCDEFGLEDMDLLGAYQQDDLAAFKARADALERQMVSIIEAHGGVIRRYADAADFLRREPRS